MRNGKKQAEATITSIRDDDAILTITNAAPGYKPMVGDTLVGVRALAPLPPAPPSHTSFNPLGFLAAVGGALLAIGHHGQPGTPCVGCVAPSPSVSPFVILNFSINGHPPTGFIEFTFNEAVNTVSQNGIAGNTAYASFTLLPPGQQATTQPAPLSQLGAVSFDPTGTILDVGEQMSGLVTGETFQISFTSLVTSTVGTSLNPATTGDQTLSKIFHPFTTKAHPVGPVPPGPKPPSGGKPIPKVPPGAPKPPSDPHNPH